MTLADTGCVFRMSNTLLVGCFSYTGWPTGHCVFGMSNTLLVGCVAYMGWSTGHCVFAMSNTLLVGCMFYTGWSTGHCMFGMSNTLLGGCKEVCGNINRSYIQCSIEQATVESPAQQIICTFEQI
ncbi:hypothetical protein AVEN_27588-1 [Araneus ventricosus]|uniref:Uncharacterized protein n=1 Tax=Araneus ventricosus TaxID=182803 RepID=A0A4Y2WP30_ARAVE|nr:hypothetical protein AVEN_27588-1 [Araneus ventricosus]